MVAFVDSFLGTIELSFWQKDLFWSASIKLGSIVLSDLIRTFFCFSTLSRFFFFIQAFGNISPVFASLVFGCSNDPSFCSFLFVFEGNKVHHAYHSGVLFIHIGEVSRKPKISLDKLVLVLLKGSDFINNFLNYVFAHLKPSLGIVHLIPFSV